MNFFHKYYSIASEAIRLFFNLLLPNIIFISVCISALVSIFIMGRTGEVNNQLVVSFISYLIFYTYFMKMPKIVLFNVNDKEKILRKENIFEKYYSFIFFILIAIYPMFRGVVALESNYLFNIPSVFIHIILGVLFCHKLGYFIHLAHRTRRKKIWISFMLLSIPCLISWLYAGRLLNGISIIYIAMSIFTIGSYHICKRKPSNKTLAYNAFNTPYFISEYTNIENLIARVRSYLAFLNASMAKSTKALKRHLFKVGNIFIVIKQLLNFTVIAATFALARRASLIFNRTMLVPDSNHFLGAETTGVALMSFALILLWFIIIFNICSIYNKSMKCLRSLDGKKVMKANFFMTKLDKFAIIFWISLAVLCLLLFMVFSTLLVVISIAVLFITFRLMVFLNTPKPCKKYKIAV